jgi:hypothetical protein
MHKVILWARMAPDHALEAIAAHQLTGLVSPATRGLVTVLLPSLALPDGFEFKAPWAALANARDSDGAFFLRLDVHPPGGPPRRLSWMKPVLGFGKSLLTDSDDEVVAMAQALVDLFGLDSVTGADGAPDVALRLIIDRLSQEVSWQWQLLDRLGGLFDLPELRERVDRIAAIGPAGPSIVYPAKLAGPVVAALYVKGVWAAKSTSGDQLDFRLFAANWSSVIDQRFDVIEITATGAERVVKLLHDAVPVAVKVWNGRWRMTPAPPGEVNEIFLDELDKCTPWPVDRQAMGALLELDYADDPLGAFATACSIPSFEPYLTTEDWRELDGDLQTFGRSSGLRLQASRLNAALGRRLAWGPWRPYHPSGGPPAR